MKLQFIKTNPTENMTLLIETPVPREQQLAIAQRLIAYDSVYAEQAGYIEQATQPFAEKRLQMMAGEFCGNASLSLAAVLAQEKGLQIGGQCEILLEVSGADELVQCRMKREEDGFSGRVAMPLPKAVERRTFSLRGARYELTVVVFEGISHVIVPISLWGEDAAAMAEDAAQAWAEDMPPAFGILLYDEENSSLRPLVCIRDVSLIWERGCGSGTSAIGAYLAMRDGRSVSVRLRQPGGVMGAEVAFAEGELASVHISGNVRIAARGVAYL